MFIFDKEKLAWFCRILLSDYMEIQQKVFAPFCNILIFSLAKNYSDKLFIEKLKQKNILISSMGNNKLRIVTHLDYKEVMHTYVLETLSKF